MTNLALIAILLRLVASCLTAEETSQGALIKQWDQASLKRGEERYTQTCQICHGTVAKVGQFPDALRFSQGKFKNGAAPHEMFQTIKHGFGQFMPAHPSMSDQEIYDVIHFLRERFVKPNNPSQYVKIDETYLAKASTMKLVAQQNKLPPWLMMDYGPTMSATYNLGAYSVMKGIAVRLDPGHGGVTKGRSWILFDQDTLQPAAGWEGVFSDYKIISLAGNRVPDDQHQRLSNIRFAMPNEPAWANPATGDFKDLRFVGRDQKRYGPLPLAWGRFVGVHYQQDRPIIEYRIAKRRILERYTSSEPGVFQRTLHISEGPHPLKHRLAPIEIAVAYSADSDIKISTENGFHILNIPAGEEIRFHCHLSPGKPQGLTKLEAASSIPNLKSLAASPKAPQWKAVIKKKVQPHEDNAPYVVDELTLPKPNPWNCRTRFGGIDFFNDPNKAAVCTWDGDVWLIDDITTNEISWRRICTGLFQPLGLRIIDGEIYVTCRDQIARLVDRNNDREIDFVEAFNSDHQVTTHWHEFTSGLAVDQKGYFYYVKAGRHGSPALVEHHGTVIQVDPDGKHSRVVATGFRATNGITNTPDGRLFMSDQEGTWNPENKIIEIHPDAQNPKFFGFTLGYHHLGEKAADDDSVTHPFVWVHRDVDRSPSQILFADSKRWGPMNQKILSLSYGTGSIYHILTDEVNGVKQGAVVAIDMQDHGRNHVLTGLMRGKFNSKDGQLYTCGLADWASSRTTAEGIYRVRYTGKASYTPVALKNYQNGILLEFSAPLKGINSKQSSLRHWPIIRTPKYGMRSTPHEKTNIPVKEFHLIEDQRAVFIECDMVTAWISELQLELIKANGNPHRIKLHNTAYQLRSRYELTK